MTERGAVVRRKFAALNLLGPRARAVIEGTVVLLADLYSVPPNDPAHNAKPGTILVTHSDGWTVQTADEPLLLVTPDPGV